MSFRNEISAYKSSSGVAKLLADEILNSTLLSENETLAKSPASVLSHLHTSIADLASIAYFEHAMVKKEVHKNTAIKLSSLLRYLNANELAGIFGYPASSSFFIGLPYDALLKQAVIDTSVKGSQIKKVRINKDSYILMLSSVMFILDHSIDINILNWDTDKPTFNITYDTNDKYSDEFTAINNPYIKSKITVYNGTKYVGFEVLGREYTRNTTVLNVNLDSVSDQMISYEGQLMGFEVLYKTSSSTDYSLLTGYPEGVDPTNGYNYSLINKNDTKSIKISFSKNSQNFTPGTHSTIKIIVYTTTGSAGNIKFPDINQDLTNSISFVMKQDPANPYEQAIVNMKPIVSTKSISSTGGRDQMSFEDIRSHVINKSYENKTITPSDLDRIASDYNCTTEKIRHDVLALKYRLFSILNDGTDYISSGMGVFRFNLDDIAFKNEIKARIIKPTNIFKYNSANETYEFVKNPVQLKDYLDDFRNNKPPQVAFPFFIKTTFSNRVESKVYDLSSDEYYFPDINYYDNLALDNVTIDKVHVYRNPSLEIATEEDIANDIEGFYMISFTAALGENLYNSLKISRSLNEIEPVKFRIVLKSSITLDEYYADCTLVEMSDVTKSARFKAILSTNNNVNDAGNLCLTNSSIKPLPIKLVYESFYYINPEMNFKIMVIFNSPNLYDNHNTVYDYYLTEEEIEQKYYISVVYEVEKIKFLSDLTDEFQLNMDVKFNDTQYAKYEEDVYETYSETVYETNDNGEIIYTTETRVNNIGETFQVNVPSVLYQKGETKYAEDGTPIIKYPKGSIIYDEKGNPTPVSTKSYYALLRYVPWFDRLFNVSDKYFDIVKSYYSLIDAQRAISQSVMDGVDLCIGFKNTSGPSKLYKIAKKDSDMTEQLDNLALSLSIGVAFNDVLSDEDIAYNKSNIIEKTKEYIYNFNGNVFSISELFQYLKTSFPSINYLEHYSINNYDSTRCQAIKKDTSVDAVKNETLCVKMDIDEENSDFVNNDIVFKPAIKITIL